MRLLDYQRDAAREQLWPPSHGSALEQAAARLGRAGALALYATMQH